MFSPLVVASLAMLTLAVGPQIDGYTRSDPGTSAISVPVKDGCSTFISHSVYEGTTLDAARCTAECDDSCDDCHFVNTWMELKDGQPTRQICALYTTSYTDADATSKSYTRPSDSTVVTCVVDGPRPYPPAVKSCPVKNGQGSGSSSGSSSGASGSASGSNNASSGSASGSSNNGSGSASGSSNNDSGSASGSSNNNSGSASGSSNNGSGSAPGSSDGASGVSSPDAYTTEVVDQFTTYFPSPTTITYGPSQTYVVTEAGSVTITDCPCTITKPVSNGGAAPTYGSGSGNDGAPSYGGNGGSGSDGGSPPYYGGGGDDPNGEDGDPTVTDGPTATGTDSTATGTSTTATDDPNDGGDGDPTDDTSSTTTGTATGTASTTTDTASSATASSATASSATASSATASSATASSTTVSGEPDPNTTTTATITTTDGTSSTTTSSSATSTPSDCVQAGGTCSGLLGSNGLLLSDDCCDGSSCFPTLDINARSLKGGSLLRRQTLLGTCSGGNPDDGTCNAAGDACDATGVLGLDPCCAGTTCTTLGLTLNGLAVQVDQCVADEPVTGPFNCATDESEQCCTASAANALQLLCTAPSSTDISSCGTQPAYCCPNDGVLNVLNGVVYTGCQAAPGDGGDGSDSNGANGDVTFTCANGEARCCTDADGLGLNLLCTGLEVDGTCSAHQTPRCCDGDQTLGAVLALNCAAPATTTPVEGGGGNSPTTFACAANYDPTCCPATAITGGLGVGAACQDPTNSACANTLLAEPLCCPTGLLDPLLASQCFAPGSEPGVIATSFGCTGADTRQCCPVGDVSELGALCTEATTDDTATCASLLGGSSAYCCSGSVLNLGQVLSTGCDPAGIVV
ncbi:unnamed protein product [Zymoseptoria tritici ST99CH_1A5]|uniref:Apple domain-containing protein n=1 Tax=Zymoseptoria tritici ST99CH_1A5 TaxID=1276529 RepID=A0A1Y6L2K1_ZYMTR|nr:unnamed protein product [Zymoseptoria tritici ST99CH_1A5]